MTNHFMKNTLLATVPIITCLISIIATSNIDQKYNDFMRNSRDSTRNVEDLFQDGKQLFRLLETEKSLLKADVAEVMHRIASNLGEYKKAYIWLEKYMNLSNASTDPRLMDQLIFYKYFSLVSDASDLNKLPNELKLRLGELQENISHFKYCKKVPQVYPSKFLYCRYSVRTKDPIFIISPLKEEILSTKPVVALFHDIITKSEVRKLKKMANDKFQDAKVINNGANSGVQTHYFSRRAQTAWIPNNNLKSLNNRLAAASNLNLEGMASENFQVAHYDVGGLYVPHYDFIEEGANVRKLVGQRIATILLYLNTVEKGGATVFPNLSLRVEPQERMALFWYNSFRNSEEGNKLTLHGACPVLSGEKWAVNKWVLSRGQEFFRRCAVDFNADFELTDF